MKYIKKEMCSIMILNFNNNYILFRVSSVLNKNVQSYGKMYMFDNCNETCWNSDAVGNQIFL